MFCLIFTICLFSRAFQNSNLIFRYNGRLFISWLQDVDDKWEKIKVTHTFSAVVLCVQEVVTHFIYSDLLYKMSHYFLDI